MVNNGYSKKNLNRIKKLPRPLVLLNVGTHGDETVGLRVAKHFEKVKLDNGTLVINVANKKAIIQKKRFISKDLNRVFPGKQKGAYEEVLANKIVPLLKLFDLVIDIHSTKTGVEQALIVVKITKSLRPILGAIAPRRVIQMKATKSGPLISHARLGIAFEYGKNTDQKTYTSTVEGIYRVLSYFKMIHRNTNNRIVPKKSAELFLTTKAVAKPKDYIILGNIKNFVFVKPGRAIARHIYTNKPLRTKKGFYPILFGKNSYKNIFGFQARKTRLLL